MIKRLHHIGIGVKDLESTVHFYKDILGLEPLGTVEWPGLKAVLFPFGNVILELIQPVGEPQLRVGESLYRLVKERGNGVHHFAFEVDDIDADVASLQLKGVRLIDEVPQQTAGGRIAWLHEEALDGVMIELCQEGYQIK